jgi:uncharacterized membrane protein HdeD (DUF308 family)
MEQTGPAKTRPARRQHHIAGHLTDSFASGTRYWWLLLIAGATCIGIAVVILRFTYTSVEAVATLFAAVCLLAAAAEATAGALSSRGWRAVRWSLAVVFVVAGVVTFLTVKATVVGLAAVMSVVFVLRGVFGVVAAIAARRQRRWRLLLIAALTELAIGSWVAASLQGPITALLTCVAAGTAVHGVAEIKSAFLVRDVGRRVKKRRA